MSYPAEMISIRIRVEMLQTESLIGVSVADGARYEIALLPEISSRLIPYISQEIEIDARSHDGTIQLIDFTPVDSTDAYAAWRAWFASCASSWSDRDDIERALGRD